MATRLITDLDAFFDTADEALEARLDAFFRAAFGAKSTKSQFRGLFQRKDYKQLFIRTILQDNTAAFRRFMDEFHISPDAMVRVPGTGIEPLFFIAVTSEYAFHQDIADSLLEMGVDVHAINPHTQFDALMTAAKNGNVDGVQYLVERTEIQPSAYVFGGRYDGKTAYDLARIGYEREESLYKQQLKFISDYKTIKNVSQYVEDAESRKERVDAYETILEVLSPLTPNTIFEVNEANLAATKARLQPYRKNVIGLARKKGIPANVIKYGIGPFLTSGPRLPGVRVAPTEVGLKHVNTSLFQKSRKRRGGHRKARKDRKTRSRK